MADVIRRDRQELKEKIGEDKFRNALAQVALFAHSKDPECQVALRIIGDTVDRARALVGKIKIDGDPAEWKDTLPSPESRTLPKPPLANELWAKGAAAVVRENRLYVMAGITDRNYFNQETNRIGIWLDCMDSQTWDVHIFIQRVGNQWTGTCEVLVAEGEQSPQSAAIEGLDGKIGEVAELVMDTATFAPPNRAKPIWAMQMGAHLKQGRRTKSLNVLSMPILNETALPGIAAKPCVHSFIYLAADAGLRESDRTAAAIVITRAFLYASGNGDVRTQLRHDNAELLVFARQIMDWQREVDTEYRLNSYPMEAQLAWASGVNIRYSNKELRKVGKEINDLENYEWMTTSVETYRKLHRIALDKRLASRGTNDCVRLVDRWVAKTQKEIAPPKHYAEPAVARKKANLTAKQQARHEKTLKRSRDMERAGMFSEWSFKGKTISSVGIYQTDRYMELIERHGQFYGGCPGFSWVARDMLRAIGIAPLAFRGKGSRESKGSHCWAGHFDPKKDAWFSYQKGGKGDTWRYFNIGRPVIYHYAPTPGVSSNPGTEGMLGIDLRPRRWKIEVQGKQVQEMTQNGIPTAEIREWILLPHF